MKKYVINFDYDSVIYTTSPKTFRHDINRQFEYLAFFVQDNCIFVSNENYTSEYLEYIEAIKGEKINIEKFPVTNYKCWWGAREDIDLEKRLNDKNTVIGLCNKLGFYHPGHILSSNIHDIFLDLKNLQSKFDSIYFRKNIGVSGQSIKIFNKEIGISELSILDSMAKNNSLIYGPWLNRIHDFGSRLDLNESHMWINNVDKNGIYRGSTYSPTIKKLASIIGNSLELVMEYILDCQKKIFSELKNIYDIKSMQFDSFVYLRDQHMGVVAAIEMNFRKTMGDITRLLHNRYSNENALSKLLFLRGTHPKKPCTYSKEKKSGFFRLTPKKGEYSSVIYFLTAQDALALAEMEESLLQNQQ